MAEVEQPCVWVIVPDNGNKGLAEPSWAFYDKKSADQGMAMLGAAAAGYRSFRLFQVPIWTTLR